MSFPQRQARVTTLVLAAILVITSCLRLNGVGFGLPSLYDRDEPVFLLCGLHMLKELTLNPGWFGHPGTTTIYTLAITEALVFLGGLALGLWQGAAGFATAVYHDPGIIVLPSRVLMVMGGVGCVYLTYRIARSLFDVPTALLAALLLAINPLHIAYSQIVRTDIQATLLMLATVLCAIAIVRHGRRRDYVLAGIMVGLACATKWPAVIAVSSPLGAIALRSLTNATERSSWLPRVAALGAISLATLFLTSPFLLFDYQTAFDNLRGEARPAHLSQTGYGFLGNGWWYISSPLAHSVGVVGLGLGLIGMAYMTLRDRLATVTIVLPAVLFLAAMSMQALIWPRWALPLLPFVAIFTAFGIVRLAKTRLPFLQAGTGVGVGVGIAGIAALATITPVVATVRSQAVEREQDTRAMAAAWAYAHIPPGRSVALEYFAFDMLNGGWPILYPVGESGCIDGQKALGGKIKLSSVDTMRGKAFIINLGTVSAARQSTCAADYLVLTFYDRYFAERTQYPGVIANYHRLMEGRRVLATFRPKPGAVGGPMVRIVGPRGQ